MLHVTLAPLEATCPNFLADLRDCGVDFGTHLPFVPEDPRLADDLLVLAAVQRHCQARLEVTIRGAEVQWRVPQDFLHEVDALFWRTMRHTRAIAHLLQELGRFDSRIRALDVLI